MWRTALRNVLSHKLRLALTVVTIALGIAFVTGTNIFTDSLRASFDVLVSQPRADVTITPRTALDDPATGDSSVGRGVLTLPVGLVDSLGNLPSVAAAYGAVSAEGAYVLDSEGKPIGPNGPPARVVAWQPDPKISSLRVSMGRAPVGAGEIALLASTASLAGKGIGDTVEVVTATKGVQHFTVVGEVTRALSGGLGGTLVVFDLLTAQSLYFDTQGVTSIEVQAKPGVSQDELAAAVIPVLPELTSVRTGAQTQDEVTARIEQGFGFLNTFLLTFGFIALFVSTFLIFNTFAMLIAQRTRELALLRAIGATRKQIYASVLAEATAVGAISAVIGLVGGVLVALGLRTLIERFGGALPAGGLAVEPSTLILAAGVGIGVTLIAASVPAWRAAVIPAVAAMRDDVSLPVKSLRRMTILGIVLMIASAVSVVLGLSSAANDAGRAALWVGVAAMLSIIGIIALTPAVSKPLLGLVGRPFRGHPVSQLAIENARRNPRRTSATGSALAIGLALMTLVTVIGASARASVTDVVDRSIGADFIVLGQGFQPMDTEVYASLRDIPAASVVTYVRNVPIEVGGDRYPMTGVESEVIDQVVDLKMTSGAVSDLGLGNAIVDDKTAASLKLTPGMTLDATFLNGPGSVRIVGTYEPIGFLTGFIVTMPTLQSIGSLERDTGIYIRAAPGADLAALREGLQERLKAFPAANLQDQADIKRDINQQFDLIFGFIYALLALSIIVAFLGIINTLSLSVYERIREIGLLRAVGLSRRQTRQMVSREALVIALLGTVVGLLIGLVFGALFQKVLEPQGITVLAIPYGQLGIFLVLGVVGGLAAAIWPAWRAARLRILTAIATQ